jgi:hypothetical protein
MKETTSPKTSKVAPRPGSGDRGICAPGTRAPGRPGLGPQSLILGALLVAGLSLALACCGTLDPQIEAKPAVTATRTPSASTITPTEGAQQDVHALLLDTSRLD